MKSLLKYRPYDVMYIDAMNFLTRSYHGMYDLSYKGKRTGMLFGISRMVLDWRKRNPGIEMVMVWEGRDSWRKKQFPIYKAKRQPQESSPVDPSNSDTFFDCVDRVRDALPCMGVSQIFADTYEADDVVFTMAMLEKKANKAKPKIEHRRLLFSSGDWDWWELSEVGDILYQHKDILNQRELDLRFEKKFHVPAVPPHMLWLFKVLTGDPSDNVSGIPRFPKKLASALCHFEGFDEGSILDALIRMGESKWAKVVSEHYWVIERNTVLLKSNMVPIQNIQNVLGNYDAELFGDVLISGGMETLYDRLQGENDGKSSG